LYVLARLNQLTQLTAIVSAPNIAQVQAIGERCHAECLFEAARILFISISNFARLATTLVHLQDFSGAVDCA
jgi:clathrin heavy chain